MTTQLDKVMQNAARARTFTVGRNAGECTEILGVRLQWKVREADTGGHYCMFEMLVPADDGVPPHRHEPQETFFVLEGEVEVAREAETGVEWLRAAPGATAVIPSGALHGFRNVSGKPARVLTMCTTGMEAFFDEAGTRVGADAALSSAPPSPEEISRVLGIAARHGQIFAPPPGA